ncbi:hypothetical protein [[Mycoplasma] mobile]|uniref:hypothetical protein n=1 Tax=[Mycoplasma] mobile TaxID=2118 RepID=UPI00003755C0|nr:hypothetical protein [[Mycoplasma] mobile]AAT27829.1 truncated late competance locus-related protein [Mycoplasma mobile 163K]
MRNTKVLFGIANISYLLITPATIVACSFTNTTDTTTPEVIKPNDSIIRALEFKTNYLSPNLNLDTSNETSNLTMFDVGQGDSYLIQYQNSNLLKTNNFNQIDTNGSYSILIDAGNFRQESTNNKVHTFNYAQKLHPTLNKTFINDKIDLFVMSHADADHLGAMDQIMSEFSHTNSQVLVSFDDNVTTATFRNVIKAIYTNEIDIITNRPEALDQYYDFIKLQTLSTNINTSRNAKLMQDELDILLNKIKTKTILYQEISPKSDLITFSDDSFLNFIAPSKDYSINSLTGQAELGKEANEISFNLFYSINNFRALFTADSYGITNDDTLSILKTNPRYLKNNLIKLDLLQINHHGSTTNRSNEANYLQELIDLDTILWISTNQHKVFGGVPTLRESFFTNLGNKSGLEKVYISQLLGDVSVLIKEKGTYEVILISREIQINQTLILNLNINQIINTEDSKNKFIELIKNITFHKYVLFPK